jgi:hypothetical protein
MSLPTTAAYGYSFIFWCPLSSVGHMSAVRCVFGGKGVSTDFPLSKLNLHNIAMPERVLLGSVQHSGEIAPELN